MISGSVLGPNRLPRSRRGRRFAFLATASLALYALLGGAGVVSALSGAIYTSNFDGSVINENVGYASKADVYLTGGPCDSGSQLPAGDYYFQVTSPNGVLLSTDAIGNRRYTIGADGFIASTSGTHLTHALNPACNSSGITIQLLPFDDTPNPGGEYKFTIATRASVEACTGFSAGSTTFEICNGADSKSDNFKVDAQPPTISVTKDATPASLGEPGGTFTFDVTVANTSQETLTLDSLVDDVYGDLNGKGTCDTGGTIAAGATYSCSFDGAFSGNAGDFQTDRVDAVASDSDDNQATDFDTATVTITNIDPSVTVTKDASPASLGEPGGTFTFDVTVHNGSEEPVTLISLVDDIYGNLDGQGSCAIGGTITADGDYSCSFDGAFTGDAGDSQTDTVTATVEDNDEGRASNFDDATVRLTDVLPTLQVTKDANPTSVDVGGSATFTVKVKNTSDETVTLTDLVDDIHGNLAGQGTCATGGTIAPGATYTCSFLAVIAADAGDSETDTVTATVEDNEENSASDSDTATVRVNVPPVEVIPTPTLPFTGGPTPTPTLPSTSTVDGPTHGNTGGSLALILALLAIGSIGIVVLSPLPKRSRR